MRSISSCIKGFRQVVSAVRGRVAVSIVAGILKVASSLCFVWLSKILVDIATGNSRDNDIGLYVFLIVLAMLFKIAIQVFDIRWRELTSVKCSNSLRSRVFSHIMTSRWEGRDSLHSGDSVSRLISDGNTVVDLVTFRFPDSIVTFIQLLAAGAFLLVLTPGLTWVLIAIMVTATIAARIFFKPLRLLNNEIRNCESLIQSHLQESIQNRILMMTLGATGATVSKLNSRQDALKDNTTKKLKLSSFARTMTGHGFSGGYLAAFLWGVFGIRSGAVTFGMMTAFLQLVGQIQRPVADLASHVPAFIKSLTSMERLMFLMETEEEGIQPDEVFSVPGISIKDLSFRYSDGNTNVIDTFSHDFTPGSFTAITGPTGEGKSTLLRLILGLLSPTSGSVSIYEGNHICKASAATRCNFMYVPQGNSLLSGTIRENLLLANPQAGEEELSYALKTACADFVFSLPQVLDSVCSEKGSGLSEGQAQRIAIARALLRPGGVLILDEATSALDPETENRLLENIRNRYGDKKTVLCVTHRTAALSFADETLSL